MEVARFDQSEFNGLLEQYLQVTSRSVEETVNTKAFYVARAATRFTLKADVGKMASQLGTFIKVTKTSKSGRVYQRRELKLVTGGQHEAPLAALIVQARRGRARQKGLYGPAMRQAVVAMLKARRASVAFLKSGWLPAIKKLEPLADRRGAPEPDHQARQIGQAKGDAIPGRLNYDQVIATIINSAMAKRDVRDALGRIGGRGLDAAFYAEAQSISDYLERKMREKGDGIAARL